MRLFEMLGITKKDDLFEGLICITLFLEYILMILVLRNSFTRHS